MLALHLWASAAQVVKTVPSKQPSAAIDNHNLPGAIPLEVIKKLNAQGLTVFLVEQNAYHALKLAHRAYVMVNGVITMSGDSRELLERPEVRAAYLEGGRH